MSAAAYLVRVVVTEGRAPVVRYVRRVGAGRVAVDLARWREDARRFTYAVALAVARRNGGHVVQIPAR